ncbi:FAD-linked oxidoreductase [Diplodia seriata]|uniref:FAD-linked oxidoreductase n=1 Tax=Diplodia seriata TaxID=420778 RepID=A0A1S8B9U1_9PEZI|nr:FAD-linked oxidoreductase [Diplodia seriata]
MATLDSLKQALRQEAAATKSAPQQPLSDIQYSDGFDMLVQGYGWATYQDFIIPQLTQLLAPLFKSRDHISVLEIGPGPKSVLGYLPSHLRRKISRYTAFEPNGLFAARLEEWLCSTAETDEPTLPCLKDLADIRRIPFTLNDDNKSTSGAADDKYDIVLFCHSMYGMSPKHRFIKQALSMLISHLPPQESLVIVFHRANDALHDDLDGLLCHRTATFPTGAIRIPNTTAALDTFAPFIAGFAPQSTDPDTPGTLTSWCKTCRALARHEAAGHHLLFTAPSAMAAFNPHASTALPILLAQVPSVPRALKNPEARQHRPAATLRPSSIRDVQHCVRWALRHGVALTVVGGGHGGGCVQSGVAAVDMAAGKDAMGDGGRTEAGGAAADGCLVVAGAGCTAGDVVREALAAGVAVPLGARPGVGAGLWLQGGVGHLARGRGLACDAVVGAVVVSVRDGAVLCVGCVPRECWPEGGVRPADEDEWMWAIKGAGTNFGVVVSVAFRAWKAPVWEVRNWIVPLGDGGEVERRLEEFDGVARKLGRDCSADAFLYWDGGEMRLGVTMFESSTTDGDAVATSTSSTLASALWGLEDSCKIVDSVGLFDAEMYMSGMHGGHGGGKTSSFKRCIFLSRIGSAAIASRLISAISTRPSPLCYLHLLQGGGAIRDVASDATAFGCRDWDFACVITGIWPRDQDGDTEAARAAVQWVYSVAGDLLMCSSGAYGADLGPDPRDAVLAARAFGPNASRLARLKRRLDPLNVLAYACPLLPRAPTVMEQKLVILVTGESGAGKDYCADVWLSAFVAQGITARVVSISEAVKREYAAATGADLSLLLESRAYKERHRPALTAFYQEQARQRPQLPEEHFLDVVHAADDVDVLLVTGMRDEAPVAAYSHLVPDRRLLEVYVRADAQTRLARRGYSDSNNTSTPSTPPPTSTHAPTLIFANDAAGAAAATAFASHRLLPFAHADLQRLAAMVRAVPPDHLHAPGIAFRHVLGIAQQAGGLALATSLLQTHFAGAWSDVDAIVCCEAGGWVYASALALRVHVPVVLVRDAGKLPPPTVAVAKPRSHISSLAAASGGEGEEERIEMERGVLPERARVVVVDDVLASGETLGAVLRLLGEAGVGHEGVVGVLVVAEFPVHRGREVLRRRGFGAVRVQSLLVFDGA